MLTRLPCMSCRPTDPACTRCGCIECGNKSGRYGCTKAGCGAAKPPAARSLSPGETFESRERLRALLARARCVRARTLEDSLTIATLCDELEARL